MKALRLAPLLALLGVASASAQVKSTLITEASYSARVAGGADKVNSFDGPAAVNLSAAIGMVKPVASKIDLGAVATLGVWGDFYLAAGPRLRFHASRAVAVDITPQLIVARGSSGSARGMLDAAVMYKDQIGLSVQFTAFDHYVYGPNFPIDFMTEIQRKPALFAGFRLGNKPGRYGMLADAVALAGVLTLFLLVCSNSGCD